MRYVRATPAPLAAVVLGGLLVALGVALAPALRSAIEIGSDEHYEVMKALLWVKGYPLYGIMWNDQPPLHTILLGLLFRCFGPTIGVARVLAVLFGLLLLAGCFVLVRKRCGTWAASVATVTLLAAPQALELSVSVMLEVPAMAVGLWALWPIYRWADSWRESEIRRPKSDWALWPVYRWGGRPGGGSAYWLVASGVLLATALQIKLTAAIFAPALCAEIFLATACGGLAGAKERARNALLWCGSGAVWFVLLGLLLGSGYRQAWASHFSARTLEAAAAVGSFPPGLLLEHPEGLAGAALGLALAAWLGRFRRIAFPYVLLLTVTLIHLVHRPWWPYYYLHFAIPLAWLTGYAAAELSRLPLRPGKRDWRRIVGLAGAAMAGATLLALIATEGGGRLIAGIERARGLPRIEDSPLIATMRRYAGRTRWVYARSSICAFHAKLPVPPELAVLVRKRFWSGQISDAQILAVIQRYAPEQILVSGEDFLADGYLREAGYAPVCKAAEGTLYVAGSLLGR